MPEKLDISSDICEVLLGANHPVSTELLIISRMGPTVFIIPVIACISAPMIVATASRALGSTFMLPIMAIIGDR